GTVAPRIGVDDKRRPGPFRGLPAAVSRVLEPSDLVLAIPRDRRDDVAEAIVVREHPTGACALPAPANVDESPGARNATLEINTRGGDDVAATVVVQVDGTDLV